jgi:uncharacterized membrane protein YeaQ/YmgE (transglycosylase-associated protein family)
VGGPHYVSPETCSSSSCDQPFDDANRRAATNAIGSALTIHLSSIGVPMSIIGWLILGLIAGFIASKIVNKSGEGILLDIVLGVAGAFVGGFIFTSVLGHEGVTGFNLYSMFVAVIGAIVLLVLYHALFRRRAL